MKRLTSFFAATLFFLTGCSTVTTESYSNNKPVLDIRNYLNGNIKATGVFIDMGGKVDKSFHVTMQGAWQGNEGTLKEHFIYSDGKTQDRLWTLHVSDDHHFTATAGDVVGTAIGTQHGNSANMKYILTITRENGSKVDVSMDDWLYLMDDKTVINRTKMKKFGITVGELVISFSKE